MHAQPIHRSGPTRRAVGQQVNQQGDGAAHGQRRRNAEGLGTLLPHHALAWCGATDSRCGLRDADCAACPVTRKFSGCTCLMLGRHPILAGTARQAVISLSLGEKELYAAVCGPCRMVGLASLMADLGVSIQAEVRTDCSAARGFALRRGARQVPSTVQSCGYNQRQPHARSRSDLKINWS